MAKSKPKRERTKQGYLPDLEPPNIPRLNDAAETYRIARDERMRLTEEEVEAADKLLALMHEHKLTTYEFDGLVVTVDTAEKVKVKRKKEPGDGE